MITATFNSGNSSTTGASLGLTPPTKSFLSTTGGNSSPFEVSVFVLITSSVLVSVISPVFSFIVYIVISFTTEPSSLLTISTLSLAATLTIVFVGSTITGSCGCTSISPVLGFTVYVVVVVLLPSFPLTIMFSFPLSRESSFSYLTEDGIFSTTTLFFTPFSLKVTLVVFSVIFPFSGLTSYVVVSLIILSLSLE